MKVIVIGATGTIGRAVADALEGRHEVVRASRTGAGGAVRVDMADPATLDHLFATVRDVDAVVCCAASGALTPLGGDASDEEFTTGLDAKLLGQVALVRRALHHLRDGGSITLTSGVFEKPTPGGAFGALVNAGLDAFVRAAAIEMERGLRVNAICPGWVRETLEKLGMDPAEGTPVETVAQAYAQVIEGAAQGQVIVPGRG
ncbi:short chain dehydrogenase [Streptomyces sp. GMR22]|uniref:short chain dehydrogenase n=1 Tax=Streptomyces sp. GMR22 TaxID=2759524 RepID=UPI0015FE6358|nr:short chain dehydrogenase [Streptomyces sp. GMR22]MBA6439523.1 short chain dehydrogenase [Streptomyces sp. GMR22]